MIQKIVVLVPNNEPIEYVMDKDQDADWINLSPKEVVEALMREVLAQEYLPKGFIPFIVHELLDKGQKQLHPFVLDVQAFEAGDPDALQSKPGPGPRTLN